MTIAVKIGESLTNASFIRKMFDQGEELRKLYGAENVYDFTLGNPDLEPPAALEERLRELVNHPRPGMHKYMSNAGYEETRAAVAANINRNTGRNLTANHVLMTVGAGGGLNVIFKTLLNPGDEVLVNSPYDKPRLWYPDFYLPEFGSYIEYYGLAGRENYDRGIKTKQSVYSRMGLSVIPVYPWTFAENWQDYIMRELRQTVIRRYDDLMSKPYWSNSKQSPFHRTSPSAKGYRQAYRQRY